MANFMYYTMKGGGKSIGNSLFYEIAVPSIDPWSAIFHSLQALRVVGGWFDLEMKESS